MEKVCKGQVVRSLAGRDKGRFFVVLDVEENFAAIADGSLRPLARPKRKKLRHLAPTARHVERLDDAMHSDKELKRLLAKLCPESPDGKTLESECDTGGHELVKK